jgi:hypothetical protein
VIIASNAREANGCPIIQIKAEPITNMRREVMKFLSVVIFILLSPVIFDKCCIEIMNDDKRKNSCHNYLPSILLDKS